MTFSEWQKKKKEEEDSTEATSFSEWHNKKYGIEDDIAPVGDTEEKERKWFEKGAFEDGFNVKNIMKTISATESDIKENLTAGVLGMGEKAIDAGAYLLGGIGGLLGADGLKNKMQEFVKEDLYNEEELAKKFNNSPLLNIQGVGAGTFLGSPIAKKLLGVDTDKDSVLGEKADSVVQAGGQLAGQIALQYVGVPWYVTSATTSFGGEVDNAFNQGATYEQAGFSAVVSTGAELLTEKLFGGSALGETGLINVDFLTKGISNKALKTLVDFGIDMGTEGFEEIASEFISTLGSQLSYEKDETWSTLLADENAMGDYIYQVADSLFGKEAREGYGEAFIGGAALGGLGNVGKVANSIKKGEDYRTELTTNEEAVFNKVYEAEIEEATKKKGEDLTKKEKAKIYDEVMEDLKEGAISTDTIEEVLGGDDYKSYKDTVDNEKSILDEFKTLGEKENPTLADQSRYAELKELVNGINENSKQAELKSKLGENVYNMLKGERKGDGSYLNESYHEVWRGKQHFEADLSKYNEKEKAIVQKAIDSGFLNNSNKTHKFVDFVAKISAQKGVSFDFTSNKKLKESGFAIDGKFVNGYVTKDGITINMNSAKALDSVVGHEITHVLEGTELYNELQKTIIEYSKTKGDYQKRLDALTKLYEGIKDADINKELTADLVGDYLFTDEDFVRHLSTSNRNVFQKIYDEIKYLCKVATAGSQEARKLEQVKHTFEKVWRESATNKVEGTKYSLSENSQKPIDKYSQKQYNDFGWARDVGAITKNELDDLYSKTQQKGSLKKFTQSSYGESIIEVNDKPHSTLGANNVFVFTKGTKNDPEITRVVRVNLSDEDSVEFFRKDIYERNDHRTLETYARVMGEEFIQYYDRNNSADYGEYANKSRAYESGSESKGNSPSNRSGNQPRGTFAKDQSNEIAPINEASSKDGVFFDGKYSLSNGKEFTQEIPLEQRLSGDALLNAEDLIADIEDVAEVSPNGYVTVYHRTTEENAKRIMESGKMSAKEDGIFFSTQKSGVYSTDYGKGVVELKVPVEKLILDDIFDSEAHLKIPLKNKNEILDVSSYLTKSMDDIAPTNYSLSNEGETSKGRFYGKDMMLDAPVGENTTTTSSPKVDNVANEVAEETPEADRLEQKYARINNRLTEDKVALANEFGQRKQQLQSEVADKDAFVSTRAYDLYKEISNLKKGVRASKELGYILDHGFEWKSIKTALINAKNSPNKTVNPNSSAESVVREFLNEEYENKAYELDELDTEYQERINELEKRAEKERAEARKAEQRVLRSELHQSKVDNIKAHFTQNGYDFDDVLKKAKNLSTFSTVDNTPQRVMEKALGYKEGQILADETVNKVAQNETEGIKWLNSYTDRKNGLIAKISKQYNIKPGSKESAAAQMYAEGFYVNDNNEIIQYGDSELAKDFPDAKVQANIKGLAKDTRIREIYDETLDMINASRTRNAYPEIQKLDNYFLHFRAMDDTFSRLGLPFNPNDIKAKDLPTDLNGVTADLKPGQPYFASAMHRKGLKTSYDLLGGLEHYLSSAKNQIYHIDDIQTLRALRNYIADNYGQANGLESLDDLAEDEVQERIKQVYDSHLSSFAKFLNEEANIIAGKTALIDRGLEGIIGRRGITFLDTINKQVGANMVGFNVSSSLTNFLAPVQAFAKTNKTAFVKGFAQTVSNRLNSITGKTDGFAENSPVMIRRKGADRFHRTPFQKVGDAGYVLMGAVDDVSTEIIARAKYNELTAKGMDSQQAHIETDKWVSRLMGDRSLGQMPQLYNSKMLGLITKFQLEVRNQLDSQFYDTIQEAKADNATIENNLEKNSKTAAKVTSTLVQLAIAQHLFGKAFEAVAGYNPAFDIISVLMTAFGLDDDEESEDTALDNIEQGFLALLEDLPYTSTLTGGRIPISNALPITELINGEDQYGNEKSRLETLGEIAPYYVLPGGYGQAKKTIQGLGMFSDEHPIAGSYTDSGNLRFPVEDTLANRVQAGIFGQYASENARDYFDNDIAPLNEKQTQEYIDVNKTGMSIQEYWDYRKGLSGLKTLAEKADYIGNLDLTDEQKNILINNVADRKEDIDMTDYGNYDSFEEFDFANKYPEKHAIAQSVGGYDAYKTYSSALNDIKADKDANGKTISGSRKAKVMAYIESLDIDYGQKIILHKSEYPSDDTYNYEICEYLNSRDDITWEQMKTILIELGFKVDSKGNITWD